MSSGSSPVVLLYLWGRFLTGQFTMKHYLAPLVAILWLAAAGTAQTPTRPAFDVASIKPSAPDRLGGPPYKLGANAFSMQGRLDHLVQQAYEVRPYQVSGGPAWVYSDFYDVVAKAGVQADSHQLRLMVQTLLAGRFHLKLHRETRMMSGYVLTVDKNGPWLPPSRTDVPPDSKGVIQMGDGIWARGAPMSQIAFGLTLALGLPVVDETKIEGHYDLRLEFEDGDDAAGSIASLFPVLHEVGLKLEARKLPIEVLVIDTVERPSAN